MADVCGGCNPVRPPRPSERPLTSTVSWSEGTPQALENGMTRGSEPPASKPEKPHLTEREMTLQEGFTIGSISPHPYHGNMDDNAAAEAGGVLQDWLGTAYVRTSPEETVELCLTRVSVHDMI